MSDFPRSVPPPQSVRELVIDALVAQQLRARLEEPPLVLPVPASMREAYIRYRFRDLARYLHVGAPPLALLVIGLSLLQTGFFAGELAPRDTHLWTLGTVVVCVLLVGTAAVVQLGAVRRRYELVASPVASVVLVKLAVMPQLLGHAGAARIESYFCMVTVMIATVALRFSFRVVAATVFGTCAIAVAAIVALCDAPDFRSFAYYYGAAASVGLFVAWQLEEKEKTAFLQAVLIEHDARLRESMHDELLLLSRHDSLSGLANRRELERRLGDEWDRLRREGKPLSVVFGDIDHFKAYNDAYGHAAGDECLARVARTLQSCLLRPADFAARYGGEEFVLVLPDTDEAGAVDVAQRALRAIDALAIPHAAAPEFGHVTISIGVSATTPTRDGSAERLLDRADQALYAAKRGGRHAVSLGRDASANEPPA